MASYIHSVPHAEAFVATCSPDELLGQVIQTLCPTYNIDAPHLLALRQLLSSTIVAPRKPPTLKRTRPDKRIGEIGSIYNTPRRSPFGPNGPPVSAHQSFYFHHQDADFERLLPQVDRSRYVWRDEPDSQSNSDGEEIPDSQESSHSLMPTPATLGTERKESTPSTISAVNASAPSGEQAAAKAHPQAQEPQAQESLRSKATHEVVLDHEKLLVPKSGPKTPRKNVSADSVTSERASVPTITITTPRSTERMVKSEYENTALSPPLLAPADVAIELPDSQETHSAPPPLYSVSAPSMPRCPDTQDTVNSTQQSEVFSPPNDFVHYTPPSQEDTQQETLSQAETSSTHPSTTAVKPIADLPKATPRRSPRTLASSPPISLSSLGKRSRGKSEDSDAAPSPKRSRSKE